MENLAIPRCEVPGSRECYELFQVTEKADPSGLKLLGVAMGVPVWLAMVISLAGNAEIVPCLPLLL